MQPNPIFLYIEDEPFSRIVMELLMTRGLGYEHVHIFDSSEQFLERLQELTPRPNIIFLDVHMRPLNGFQILELLRQQPEFQDKPIIALTASVMHEEIELLKEAGFDGAIAKPVDLQTFPHQLQQILCGEEVWNII